MAMVISRAEADALLARALVRYENDVEVAMTATTNGVQRPVQHAFDAAVSFHWNTGGIARATWVRLWKAKAERALIWDSLTSWSKAGGKVLPALKARREREFLMLMDGLYRTRSPASEPRPTRARWAVALSPAEVQAVFEGLR